MAKKYYITTPIYYANSNLHIGHAYSTIACDVVKKWHTLFGRECFFLTGMDEHGEKIFLSAKEKNIHPQEWVDRMAEDAKKLWKFLNISYDDFIRTTEPRHEKTVQYIFKKIAQKGDIYKGVYSGPYCVSCESYFTEAQVRETGGKCPDCGRPISEIKSEDAYFFRLSKYQKKLLKFYEENPGFLMPEDKANKTLDTVKSGLRDLCLTRQNLEWGIPNPIEEGMTIYVWFDALINYVSAIGYPSDSEKFNEIWPADCHVVGKEIFYFHTVIWPAMLMAAEIELPKMVFGHGWWTIKSEKMSKSKGNIITPYEICEKYPPDVLRYFFMREVPFGQDGGFSMQRISERYTSDLANSLGNLFRRVETMCAKYFDGRSPSSGKANEKFFNKIEEIIQNSEKQICTLKFSKILEEIWKLIDEANAYIEQEKPWALKKENPEKLQDVMGTLLTVLNFLKDVLYPFIPEKSKQMSEHLGVEISKPQARAFPHNRKIPGGEILFPVEK